VIGVPNKKYLWIMARKPTMSASTLKKIKSSIEKLGYPIDDMTVMQHNDTK